MVGGSQREREKVTLPSFADLTIILFIVDVPMVLLYGDAAP